SFGSGSKVPLQGAPVKKPSPHALIVFLNKIIVVACGNLLPSPIIIFLVIASPPRITDSLQDKCPPVERELELALNHLDTFSLASAVFQREADERLSNCNNIDCLSSRSTTYNAALADSSNFRCRPFMLHSRMCCTIDQLHCARARGSGMIPSIA